MKKLNSLLVILLLVISGSILNFAQEAKPKNEPADDTAKATEKAPADVKPVAVVKPKVDPLVLDLMVAQDNVNLGAPLQFTVRVLNTTDKDRKIREMVYDYESVYLTAEYKGKTFTLGQDVDQDGKTKSKPKKYVFEKKTDWQEDFTLGAGRSFKMEFEFPAVAVGEYSFTAHYKRNRRGQKVVSKSPLKVTVAATATADTLGLTMKTDKGNMTFKLYPEHALNTVTHLIQEIKANTLSGKEFYRVITDKAVFGGDTRGRGAGDGGPGYQLHAETPTPLGEAVMPTLPNEGAMPELLKALSEKLNDETGLLVMVNNNDEGHVDSRFLICYGKLSELNDAKAKGKDYTIVGQITAGDDVLDKLVKIEFYKTTEKYKADIKAKRRAKNREKDKVKREKLKKALADYIESFEEQLAERVNIRAIDVAEQKMKFAATEEGDKATTQPESTDEKPDDEEKKAAPVDEDSDGE